MRVITLIGADASGKDTQVELLKKHFEAQGKKVQVITIWHSLMDFQTISDKKMLQEIVETFLLKYEAHARSFFLLACLKNSLSKVDPSNDIILLNGFFHKYWASEMSYGVESELWEKNISTFMTTDKIFYLKTPVEKCLARKTSWSKYEQGLGQYTAGTNKLSQEGFQQSLHKNLDKLSNSIKNLITLDGAKSIDDVFSDLTKHL